MPILGKLLLVTNAHFGQMSLDTSLSHEYMPARTRGTPHPNGDHLSPQCARADRICSAAGVVTWHLIEFELGGQFHIRPEATTTFGETIAMYLAQYFDLHPPQRSAPGEFEALTDDELLAARQYRIDRAVGDKSRSA